MIKVNPAYISQSYPACGHIEKANRNKKCCGQAKIHLFNCKNCGYKSNDDQYWRLRLLKQLQRTRL
ncbi:MAG: hypothetical protein UH654_01645 [Lachnospiraceae bacterium]|nr:hypothetical protein [Lachnospiraceae bacterium]